MKKEKANANENKVEEAIEKKSVEIPKITLPDFIAHRVKVFDEYKAKAQAKPVESKEITVTLPDGKQLKGVAGQTTPYDIGMKISKKLAEEAVVAKV